jgi:hypothetical protein
MKVHILKPYSLEKNLGKAYNEAMAMIPDGDWACLMDYDTMFLTPDCGQILHEHAMRHELSSAQQKVLFTCYTNRIHPLSIYQLWKGEVSWITDIQYHVYLAERIRDENRGKSKLLPKAPISGFLMMFPKYLWDEFKFNEDMKCLGVDNDFSIRVQEKYPCCRMDDLYVWHTYRLKNGIKDKSHLI